MVFVKAGRESAMRERVSASLYQMSRRELLIRKIGPPNLAANGSSWIRGQKKSPPSTDIKNMGQPFQKCVSWFGSLNISFIFFWKWANKNISFCWPPILAIAKKDEQRSSSENGKLLNNQDTLRILIDSGVGVEEIIACDDASTDASANDNDSDVVVCLGDFLLQNELEPLRLLLAHCNCSVPGVRRTQKLRDNS